MKHAKNRKDGFQVLVSNGNYNVNLSKAYPKSLREWVSSNEFQETCWSQFLEVVKGYNAVTMDITWLICAVSCKYEYNPNGSQDAFDRHLEASHFISIDKIGVAGRDGTSVHPFVPIVGGLSKMPRSDQLNMVNLNFYNDSNVNRFVTGGYASAG